MIKFFVPGQPVGKGRPRFTKTGRPYTPKKTAEYESHVEWTARKAMWDNGRQTATDAPCAVFIDATYEIPPSYSKRRKVQCYAGEITPGKPDVDNVQKAILDALNGVVYLDDKQVVLTMAVKRYARENETLGATVTVIPLDGTTGMRKIMKIIERLEENT